MKKTYAKSLAVAAVLGLCAVSAQATEATTCAGTATKVQINGGSGATDASATGYFRQGFDFQCSNNVLLSHDEQGTNGPLVVSSGSLKGNQYFAGNSNGGAITPRGKCDGGNDACTTGNITSGIDAGSS